MQVEKKNCRMQVEKWKVCRMQVGLFFFAECKLQKSSLQYKDVCSLMNFLHDSSCDAQDEQMRRKPVADRP